ncbi:MAG: YceI family protein [Mucilaginibacter sp.]|nr:YceI family protein [Mucilaginibacter sp.]
MKRYIFLIVLPLAALLAAFKPKSPVSFTIDPAKSTVKWTGYAEVGKYAPTGIIKVKSGALMADGTTLAAGKVTIDMQSLNQSNKEMETHLRGSDFFDCEKFPEAVFVITSVKGNIATGNVTIKGITNQISFPVTIAKNPDGYFVKALVKIDRTKFAIKYNSKSYFQDPGNYAIKNEFDVEVSLYCN